MTFAEIRPAARSPAQPRSPTTPACAARTRRKSPISHSPRLNEEALAGASGSASILAISFCIARADGAPSVSLRRIVSPSSSRTSRVAAASSGSRASACSTRCGVAAAQRSRSMPRQERFDLLALGRFLFRRVHGQPRSTPAPSAVPIVSSAHRTCASSPCSPGFRRSRPLPRLTSRGSRRDR